MGRHTRHRARIQARLNAVAMQYHHNREIVDDDDIVNDIVNAPRHLDYTVKGQKIGDGTLER